MSEHDKIIEYELQIEDMLHALQDRLREFEKRMIWMILKKVASWHIPK